MSIVNFDPGEIAYEAYKLASDGVSLVSGAPLPEWDEQEPAIRHAWSAVEDGVIIGFGIARGEDAPASETPEQAWERRTQAAGTAPASGPQPATVIVVTEVPVGDGKPVQRRYQASFDGDYMAEAFAAGMQAARDLAAAQEPDSARDALGAQTLHDSPGADL